MPPFTGSRTTLRIKHHCAAPPVRVFDAWLLPDLAGLWLFATAARPMTSVIVDARNGGAFRFIERRAGRLIEHRGRYAGITRPQCLAFVLHSPDCASHATRVTVQFAGHHGGCRLLLAHEEIPAEHAAHVEARWTGMFYGLDTVLALQDAENTIGN